MSLSRRPFDPSPYEPINKPIVEITSLEPWQWLIVLESVRQHGTCKHEQHRVRDKFNERWCGCESCHQMAGGPLVSKPALSSHKHLLRRERSKTPFRQSFQEIG